MYPALVPPKSGNLADFSAAGGNGGVGEGGSSKRRRVREEQEAGTEVGEPVSTAAVALKAERYRPRIYGFQLNETAKLQRWQEAVRNK